MYLHHQVEPDVRLRLFWRPGAGDGTLPWLMYGEEITPKSAQAARSFGVLDNFLRQLRLFRRRSRWSTSCLAFGLRGKNVPVGIAAANTHTLRRPLLGGLPRTMIFPRLPGDRPAGIWKNFLATVFSYRHYGESSFSRWCNYEQKEVGTSGPPKVEG